jgi:hypothetical protein
MKWSRTCITVALSIIALSAPSVGCQQLQLIKLGVKAPSAAVADARPSAFVLTAKSVGWSAFGSLLGGLVGLDVDDAYCKRHHRGDQDLFGPCFLYANEGFAGGWIGGAIVGSTIGAVRAAEKRGCARSTAIGRAMIGAVAGSAPGAIMAARRSGRYSASRSTFIGAAPLLSGIGAAVAVVGCHAL